MISLGFSGGSVVKNLPGGSVVKNLPASAGDARDIGSIAEWEGTLGRSPGGGNGNLLL